MLYASLFFATPTYVACEDLYPDEWLDVLGIAQNPVDSSNSRTSHPIVVSFPDPIPYVHPFQWHHAEGSYLLTFTSELEFSVTLRC